MCPKHGLGYGTCYHESLTGEDAGQQVLPTEHCRHYQVYEPVPYLRTHTAESPTDRSGDHGLEVLGDLIPSRGNMPENEKQELPVCCQRTQVRLLFQVPC